MHTLVFDITAGGVAVALYEEKKQIALLEKVQEFGQAETLAYGVKEMLDENKLQFQDIGLVGVCVGPGSFTGVRASIAFARGLSFAKPELYITGVSAFEIYAHMLSEKNRAFYNAVIIETKRDDFYFQLFDENMKKISQPLALERDAIIDMLKGRQVSFIGDGVERFLSQSTGLQIKWVELSSMTDAKSLFEVTYQKFLDKTLDFPKPLYIRGSSACVK